MKIEIDIRRLSSTEHLLAVKADGELVASETHEYQDDLRYRARDLVDELIERTEG